MHAEQAGANLAVRGEADAIAMAAERFTHRRDDANLAATISKAPALGCGRRIVSGEWPQLKATTNAVENFATEVAITEGRIVPGAGGFEAMIDAALVDYSGALASGRLVRGDNPVLMTFELLLEAV